MMSKKYPLFSILEIPSFSIQKRRSVNELDRLPLDEPPTSISCA